MYVAENFVAKENKSDLKGLSGMSGMELVTLEGLGGDGKLCSGCMGEVTGEQASQIMINHFKNLPAASVFAIGTGLIAGDFTAIGNEGKKLAEEICTVGAVDKIKVGIEKYYPYIFAVAGGVGATMVGYKLFKHKGRK